MELTENQKRTIWEEGTIDDKYPSDQVRKDACGAFIRYSDFGDRDSVFGWEVDHIYPASRLKADDDVDNFANLRPLHWKNNASKGANYPYYTACVVADDENATNIEVNVGKVVNERKQEELRELYRIEA